MRMGSTGVNVNRTDSLEDQVVWEDINPSSNIMHQQYSQEKTKAHR